MSAHATSIPTFTPAGSMQIARAGHQATLLLDGRVLVTGGYDNTGAAIARPEIFSAVTRTWSIAAANIVARMDHASTRLRDGRVLVVGGASPLVSCTTAAANAEVYDPATDRWSSTRNQPLTAGSGMTAVELSDGRVLVAGGNRCGTVVSTAVLLDPSTGTWSDTASMEVPSAFHSAVRLADSRVLVAGGAASSGFSTTAEIYNPADATWTSVSASAEPRGVSCRGYAQTFLAILQSGSVLAAGGIQGDCASGAAGVVNADLFDPGASRWSPAAKFEVARALTTPTLLADGRILVAGGYGANGVLSSAEFFDPATGGWNLSGSLQTARAGHTATRLVNGSVLIAGGNDGVGRTATAEIYLPEIAYASSALAVPRGYSDRAGSYNFGTQWSAATNARANTLISYAPGSERRILEWDKEHTQRPFGHVYVREIGAGMEAFHSIRIDQAGSVWAVSASTNTIVKFDSEGRILLQFGRRPSPPDGADTPSSGASAVDRYLDGPTDVTWDQTGNIFVSDGAHGRIVKYSADGQFLAAAGRPGSAPGEMKAPHAIVADAKGNIYVADGGNARIQVFDGNLNLVAVYDSVGQPWALCVTPGPHQYLYSASNPDRTDTTKGQTTGEIYKLELDGTIVGRLGRADNAFGNFRTLHSIDCRQDNDLLGTYFVDGLQGIKLKP